MRERWVDEQIAADDPGMQEQAKATLRKYDQEFTYRERLGWCRWPVALLASALTVFQLYTALFGTYSSLIQGAIHVAGGIGLVFLLYPAKKSWAEQREDDSTGGGFRFSRLLNNTRGVTWYDLMLSAAALWTNFYIVVNYERLTTRSIIIGFSELDYFAATLGILLILEAARRCVGLPIVVIASCALLYGIFGEHMPIFAHPGFEWNQMATETFFTSSSIFGTPIQVSSTFIFLFLIFGVMLVKTNIGQFFNDIAFALTGRFTGGTAKAAVVASGMQGMVSGSSVANTVASGSFTIPMMKRAGFRPEFAAATEASASTGGQLMPPIMGAAVFIMAEYTGVPYNEIIILAIVPALLYFSGVFMGVHFEARRRGVHGVSRDQLPAVVRMLTRSYLFLPLIVIIGLLLSGRSPANAALFGIATAFLVSLLHKDTRMSLTDTIRLLENGARIALPVIAACACAGIIAGTVTKTGLGGKLAGGILDLAFGNFALILLFTMVACLILGMGLPTTANYVVTATIAAPILVQFDVPLIAAHLFVFYFGIVADITPPVCLAAYAGSGLAGANPMRSGVNAVKVAIAAFIIPYVFVAAPELVLQDATVTTFLPIFLSALVGMLAISAGIMGFFVVEANPVERILLIAAGLTMVQPVFWVSMLGLLVMLAIGAMQYRRRVAEPSVAA